MSKLLKVGQKIWLDDEKKPYKVRACDSRYAVCTKPFNLQHTVLYSIVDQKTKIRGTENYIFCMGFESDEDCKDALSRLQVGESEISKRNRVLLNIVRIEG